MDTRYMKPFALHPKMRAQQDADAKAAPPAVKAEAKKKAKAAAPPPESGLAARRAHIIETKPSKKEVLAYFTMMVEEIAAREDE